MSVFLGKRQVIQKVDQIGQPQWSLPFSFFTPKTTPSHGTLKIEPTLVPPTAAGGSGSAHSPEIGPTLVRLFYDNIMITLATDLVQHFYTHQQVRDNQAVMITSLKKDLNHFLDEVISKGRIFFLDSGEWVRKAVSHTHAGPKVVLTAFESFRSENI
jgi:hypothetical protein